MLTVWGRANSSNVMKVLWACEELGTPFERLEAGGAFGRTTEPAYLALNPNGLVPTVVEPDGFALWESHAILRYLAATRPGGEALHPAEPRRRARVDQWMDWVLSALTPPMTTVFLTHVRVPEPERDMAAAARAEAECARLWGMVEAELEGLDHLLGDFSLTDIAFGPQLHRWFLLPVSRPDHPRLRAWKEKLEARPGHARHLGSVPMT